MIKYIAELSVDWMVVDKLNEIIDVVNSLSKRVGGD